MSLCCIVFILHDYSGKRIIISDNKLAVMRASLGSVWLKNILPMELLMVICLQVNNGSTTVLFLIIRLKSCVFIGYFKMFNLKSDWQGSFLISIWYLDWNVRHTDTWADIQSRWWRAMFTIGVGVWSGGKIFQKKDGALGHKTSCANC